VSLKNHIVQNAPFSEMVVVTSLQANNPAFEIIIDEEINLNTYCRALLNKVFETAQSQFPNFISYQCKQVKDALKWLNKFEKLLANNEDLFTNNKALSRYNKLFNLIEQKRIEVQPTSVKEVKTKPAKKYINAECEERYYSFHELKFQLDNFKDENEKILRLTEELYNYQQANIEFINTKIPNYDEQCKKEIEQIYALRKLKSELETYQKQSNPNQLPFNKIKFNGNVNQLVDIFYQLNRELFVGSVNYIDAPVNDIVAVIVNSFVDKQGKEISPETIKTILTPSKYDKRPKTHKRIDIDKML
jgi:hypothetical protein